ncbi:MAG: V-type ATP synthase subunit I [Candidatus Poribacteria bacterium]
MAVNRMQKLQLVAHNSYRPALIKFLQDLEVLHIVDLTQEASSETAASELESEPDLVSQEPESRIQPTIESIIRGMRDDLSELQFAINYLTKFEMKRGFLSGFLENQVMLSEEEYADILAGIDAQKWQDICNECRSLEAEFIQLTNRQNKLKNDKSYLLPWPNLDISLDEIRDTEKTVVRLGIIPIIDYNKLSVEIEGRGIDVFFEIISESKIEKYLLAVFLKEDEDIIMPMLVNHGFSPTTLPADSGKPPELLARIEAGIQNIETRKTEIYQRSVELAAGKINLMALYDHKLELLAQEEARENFIHTKHTFFIEGWIREKEAETLKDKLLQNFEEIHVELSEPSEADEPPVDMENRRLFSPFQMVTNLYGIPKYREIDPTPLIAPFFAFFFGICLTDAGYGLALTVIAFLLARRFVSGEGAKQLFKILILAGGATIIVGVLTAGWFGISPQKLPGFLIRLRVLDVQNKQTYFFYAVLGLGFLQVWFGFVVKTYLDFRARNWAGAFLSQIPWLIVMTGSPAFIGTYAGLSSELRLSILALFVVCCVLVIAFSDQESQNVVGRIGTGFFELYSRISGSFGDILSYSRLFALGLATGIIASVVNTMAGMTWNIPYIGKIVTVGILIGGHLFNILINALGGFIHTARLQFVEFFTKFYEGGGEPFKPFKKERLYTVITDM